MNCLYEQFPMRYAATKALGRIVTYQAKCEAATVEVHLILLLVARLQDDSSDVRRKALSGLKSVAKVQTNRSIIVFSDWVN